MNKERELLGRLLSNWEHPFAGRFGDLFDEVRVLLSTPEPEKREPLSDEELEELAVSDEFLLFCSQDEFNEIARAGDPHHGIGRMKNE